MDNKCENCGNNHIGEYGSGRFCSSECARGFSTKAKRIEINKAVSKKILKLVEQGKHIHPIKSKVIKHCLECKKEFEDYKGGKKIFCTKYCTNKSPIWCKNNGGLRKGSGRGKKGWYKGYWCDSSWELAWIIYQIDNGVNFKRNLEGFEYKYNNKKHKYFPDFIIDGTYYEIKGYMTKQTEAKLNQFPKPITVLGKIEMKEIIKYVSEKYGKDYVSLYE